MTLHQAIIVYFGVAAGVWSWTGAVAGVDHGPLDLDLETDTVWETGIRPLLLGIAWPGLVLALLAMTPAWVVSLASRRRRRAQVVQERLSLETAADRARRRP